MFPPHCNTLSLIKHFTVYKQTKSYLYSVSIFILYIYIYKTYKPVKNCNLNAKIALLGIASFSKTLLFVYAFKLESRLLNSIFLCNEISYTTTTIEELIKGKKNKL